MGWESKPCGSIRSSHPPTPTTATTSAITGRSCLTSARWRISTGSWKKHTHGACVFSSTWCWTTPATSIPGSAGPHLAGEPHYDYYLWWPEEQGHPPYRKSHFDEKGDAWCYNAPTRSYYLHYFARQQPDLNWQSPKVRAEIYDILRFWLDKGVDGFRLDSIPTSQRHVVSGDRPSQIPGRISLLLAGTAPATTCTKWTARYSPATTVRPSAKARKPPPEEGWKFIAPERQELDMLYHFGAADIRNETEADDPATGIPYSLLALKRMYAEWDAAVGDGWPTIYLGNHDQPRMVSALRQRRPWVARPVGQNAHDVPAHDAGSPYWLAGDELGMTNIRFTRIEEYDDIDTRNHYRKLLREGGDTEQFLREQQGNRTRQRPHALPMGWNALRGILHGETLASRQSQPHGGKRRPGAMRPRFRIELLQTGRNAAQRTSGPGLRLVPAGRCRQPAGIRLPAGRDRPKLPHSPELQPEGCPVRPENGFDRSHAIAA